jgi:hypothetical protein
LEFELRNPFFFAATLVAAGLLLSSGLKPAAATPATLGFYPSTDVYTPGTFHFDFDTYSKSLTRNIGTTAGITYGFGNDTDRPFGRSEVGFDYNFTNIAAVTATGDPQSGRLSAGDRISFNAKTQLFANTEAGTRVVAGLWGLGTKDGGLPNYAYVTGSKTFGFGRVHLGVAKALRDEVVGDDDTSLQLGFDRYLTPKLQFAVDYYTGDGALSGIQPTLYYYINDKANFGLGYFRLNNSDASPRNQVYFCFDYNFDFKGPTVTNVTPTPETAPAAPAAN